MLPISLSSSPIYSLFPKLSSSISFSSLIVFNICCFLLSFYCFQFLSNLLQYSWLYLLSDHLNNFLTVNLPGNSSCLNVPSSHSCLAISSISHWYSLLNSSTTFFALFRFSFPSQVSDSIINPFYCTKYLFFPLTYCLFRILSTFYSFSSSIITRASCSFLCPFTCPIYLYILLTLTTGCIFIVLDSSNSTIFVNTIFFTL